MIFIDAILVPVNLHVSIHRYTYMIFIDAILVPVNLHVSIHRLVRDYSGKTAVGHQSNLGLTQIHIWYS